VISLRRPDRLWFCLWAGGHFMAEGCQGWHCRVCGLTQWDDPARFPPPLWELITGEAYSQCTTT
jgi:hypothetical protein